jgi:hypothetical protein
MSALNFDVSPSNGEAEIGQKAHQARFTNCLARIGSYDVHAEDLVSVLLDDEFDKATITGQSLCYVIDIT